MKRGLGKIHPKLSERFRERLKSARLDKGLTHVTFAGKAGITVGYVSLLESGERTPTLEMIEKCAAALGMDPGALLRE